MSDDDDSNSEARAEEIQHGGLREDMFGKKLGGRPTKVAKLAKLGPQKGQLGVFDYIRAAASAKACQETVEKPASTLNGNVCSTFRDGIEPNEQAPFPIIESPTISAASTTSEVYQGASKVLQLV